MGLLGRKQNPCSKTLTLTHIRRCHVLRFLKCQPVLLRGKHQRMQVDISTASWIIDYLTDRPVGATEGMCVCTLTLLLLHPVYLRLPKQLGVLSSAEMSGVTLRLLGVSVMDRRLRYTGGSLCGGVWEPPLKCGQDKGDSCRF